jgi:hypothetical protein
MSEGGRIVRSMTPASIEVAPATADRFDDVATVLGPKRPDATVCWCLSHRLDAKTNRDLVGPARGEYVRRLCSRTLLPACSHTSTMSWPGGPPLRLGRGWSARRLGLRARRPRPIPQPRPGRP